MIPQIASCLEDQAWVVRRSAVQVLGQWKDHSLQVAPQIAKRIADDDPNVRNCAIKSLMQIDATPFVPDIAQCLKDGDDEVRQSALHALGQLDAHAVPFVP